MDVSGYIGFVSSEGELFAAAAERGELSVDIAACPGWDMRELVRHLGLIHLWAAANVAFPDPDWLDIEHLEELEPAWPELAVWPDDDHLVAWYRVTLLNLIRVLETAPADITAATFLPAPSPLSMWSRRQASEIAIHRFDAESSRGMTTRFEPKFASDMLDELVSGFAPRPRARALGIDEPRVIHVQAEDTNDHWYLTIGNERTVTERQGDDADLTLTGTAASLYLLLWNRTPEESVTMSGDGDLMDLWRANFRIRWS